MSRFVQLTPFLQGCVLQYVSLLLYEELYILVAFIQQKRRGFLVVLQMLITLFHYGLFWTLNQVVYHKPVSALIGKIYALPVSVYLLLLSILTMIMVYRVLEWKKHHITSSSIKEAFDQLPAGLCYYWENGLIKFSNIKMESICKALMHTNLMNGKEFYEYLKSGENDTCLQKGDIPIYQFDAGIYSFQRNILELEGNALYEIIANDVTEEYQLHKELEEKNKLARNLNRRLKQIGEKITEVTIEKEILSSKIHIHDDWGRVLLLTRQYLMQPDAISKDDVYTLWDNCINSTKEQGKEYHQDTYEDVYRYADMLGIKIEIDGRLPQYEVSLITLTIRTCISNIEKHTSGDTVFIKVWEDDSFVHLTVQDNGNNCNPVVEKGGLANLRKKIQEAGGTMTVSGVPKFQLCVNIRKEGQDGI